MKESKLYIPHNLGVKLSKLWDLDHPDDADENATWGTVDCPLYDEVIDWFVSKNIYFEICPVPTLQEESFDEFDVKYYINVYGDKGSLILYAYEYSTPIMSSRQEALNCAIEYVIDNILHK